MTPNQFLAVTALFLSLNAAARKNILRPVANTNIREVRSAYDSKGVHYRFILAKDDIYPHFIREQLRIGGEGTPTKIMFSDRYDHYYYKNKKRSLTVDGLVIKDISLIKSKAKFRIDFLHNKKNKSLDCSMNLFADRAKLICK
jgi:hypothetical protein